MVDGPWRNPLLTALEELAALEAADSIEAVLHAAVEAGCAATGSRRGLAGLFDGEGVASQDWYDVDAGWTRAPLRWELDEGAPGHVCGSGTPLACNDLPRTAEGLPEATELLGLERFACVPLPGATGGPLGFLEVGNRSDDYTADEVRCLSVVARRAATRLGELAGEERREVEERVRAEIVLGGRGLFSLDPEVVLAETAGRARDIVGGQVTAIRLERPSIEDLETLATDEQTAVREAALTRAPSQVARVLALPLVADDRALGAVVLRDGADAPEGQRELLGLLAARAAVALEHALLYSTQADIARRLQERLLPLEPPPVPGLDIAVAYRSASRGAGRGGDFLDFFTQGGSHLALAIGDVAGKGVEAMATTVITKYALRAVVRGGLLTWPVRPGAALQELHNSLLGELDSERFVTILFALVNARLGRLQLATAGHPAPLIVRTSGVERPLLLTAPAIGIELEAALTPYPAETVELEQDDLAVFYTDGIAELRDRRGGFFEDHMPSVLEGLHGRPAAEVVERLLDEAGRFAAQPAADDIALVCLRIRQRVDVNSELDGTDSSEHQDEGRSGPGREGRHDG